MNAEPGQRTARTGRTAAWLAGGVLLLLVIVGAVYVAISFRVPA